MWRPGAWNSYAVCRSCGHWELHSSLPGKCTCGKPLSKWDYAQSRRATKVRSKKQISVPAGASTSKSPSIAVPSTTTDFNALRSQTAELLKICKQAGIVDNNTAEWQFNIPVEPEGKEETATDDPNRAFRTAKTRCERATTQLAKANSRVIAFDEEIGQMHEKLRKLQSDKEEAIQHRDERSDVCQAATKALDDARAALLAANKSKEEADRIQSDSGRKPSNKRGSDDVSSVEKKLGEQLSQALSNALKEKQGEEAMQTDNDEPPIDAFMQILKASWAAAVAERKSQAEAADENPAKTLRSG